MNQRYQLKTPSFTEAVGNWTLNIQWLHVTVMRLVQIRRHPSEQKVSDLRKLALLDFSSCLPAPLLLAKSEPCVRRKHQTSR